MKLGKVIALTGASVVAAYAMINLFQCDAPLWSVEWLYASCSAQFWMGILAVCGSVGRDDNRKGGE